MYSTEEGTASRALRVGLLAISGRKVTEVLAAPHGAPIDRLSLSLLEKMHYSLCTVCRALFRRSTDGNWGANISRAGLSKAAEREKGFIYWLSEVADRRRKDHRKRTLTYERRYVCPDRVHALQPIARS